LEVLLLFPNGEEIQMDGKQENRALEDVTILWSKRVKVGSKNHQNRLFNRSALSKFTTISTQLTLSKFVLSLNSSLLLQPDRPLENYSTINITGDRTQQGAKIWPAVDTATA
jgi:hypothetical protein